MRFWGGGAGDCWEVGVGACMAVACSSDLSGLAFFGSWVFFSREGTVRRISSMAFGMWAFLLARRWGAPRLDFLTRVGWKRGVYVRVWGVMGLAGDYLLLVVLTDFAREREGHGVGLFKIGRHLNADF